MELQKGISIHNQLKNGFDAVTINSGVVFNRDQVADKVNFEGMSYIPQYEDHAYIAKRDWRALTAMELSHIKAGNKRNEYNTIYLGDLPEQLTKNLERFDLTAAKSMEEVTLKLAGDAQRTKELSSNLNSLLSSLAGGSPFKFHCIGTNYPNLEMVGCNKTKLPVNYKPEDIRYLGMHNDSSQKMSLHTAHQFGNRICINLGAEPRSFLFVNLSMIQLINMLKKKIDIKANKVDITNIRRFFFEYYPDYPVIKVEQKPYQYYIAATDNCLHDGSTLGNSLLDITMIYFGGFHY